ncbi:MAG: hypothetical protein HY352_03215 [Candidatus Omnitrophica bacterium]|nr:hypothetical protein [Candidatus Omnitrophota bacterium]
MFSRSVCAADLPDVHGFVEAVYGPKFLGNERTQKDEFNVLEQRLQLKATWQPPRSAPLASWNPEVFYKGDLVVDEYDEAVRYKIREAHVSASPFAWLDMKLGRQILTWGTGDLLFINDVFPKDFVSFFIGRDDEYLKVPSDAAKASFFSPWGSLDLVLIPFFTPDTPITGDRLSFFDTTLGQLAGEEANRLLTEPAFQPKHTEIAGRISRTVGGYEIAGYAFRGFFKQAMGIKNQDARELFYPELAVYGASLRGPAPEIGGITYGEVGYSDSLEDRSGKNRLIENSSMKYLAGYERDFPNDLRVGLQYAVEQMLDFTQFKASFQSGDVPRDEFRQLMTCRITKLFWMQTLEASFFAFYSPTDDDAHLRPRLTWQMTDQWKSTVGANVFFGQHDWTEFGQLEDNDNVYVRIRYSF